MGHRLYDLVAERSGQVRSHMRPCIHVSCGVLHFFVLHLAAWADQVIVRRGQLDAGEMGGSIFLYPAYIWGGAVDVDAVVFDSIVEVASVF